MADAQVLHVIGTEMQLTGNVHTHMHSCLGLNIKMCKIDYRRPMTQFSHASFVLRFLKSPVAFLFFLLSGIFSNYAFNALETEVNMLIYVKRLIFLQRIRQTVSIL